MTCGEFLNLLQNNKDKELYFEREYDKRDNGNMEVHGFRVLQRLGDLKVYISDNQVTLTFF